MNSIKLMPKEERPRERMLLKGASALTNPELLALLIGSGTKEDSSLSIAVSVLALGEGSLRGLSNMQPEELKNIKGIGNASACRIAAAIELGRRIAAAPPRKKLKLIGVSEAAGLFMEEMRHLQQEKLRVAMLNSKGELMAMEDVSVGGLYSASASPREVFANAVRKGACGVILAHNHPSGDPTPSADDLSVTRTISAAGKLLGIDLVDHIIIGDGRFVSLKEMGVI